MSSRAAVSADPKEIKRWDNAMKVVESEGVRVYRFLPSGLGIWTVIGRECEYLIHPAKSIQGKPYCACDDFHYRVLSARTEECYHLVAAKKAIAEERYTIVEMRDKDFQSFIKGLLASTFPNIS